MSILRVIVGAGCPLATLVLGGVAILMMMDLTAAPALARGPNPPPPEYQLFIVPQVNRLEAVNDHGVAVGYSTTAPSRAYGFQNGSAYQLGSATGYFGESSQAYDINNHGTIAARSNKYNFVTSQYETSRPYLIINGLWTVMFDCVGSARAVNLSTQATGDAGINSCMNQRTFFYEGGSLDTLGVIGIPVNFPGGGSWGLGMNNSGTIVGQSTTTASNYYRGFVRQPGGALQELPSLGGFSDIAMDINDHGVIAGSSQAVGANIRCVTWENGQLLNHHPLGSPYSEAAAINNNGVIVGESNNRATMWRGIDAIDLNTVVTMPTGHTLRMAHDISDSGYIVGSCQTPTGTQGFMLKPLDVDTDGDGLMDDWERYGVPYFDDTGAYKRVVLPNADRLKKNLYVEVDAMLGFAPPDLTPVINAFAGAPVLNTGTTNGVILTIDIDEDDLDHFAPLPVGPGGTFPPLLQTYRDAHFGTEAQQGDEPLLEAKAKAYRYCIFIDKSEDNVLGRARGIYGRDFYVSAGEFDASLCPACSAGDLIKWKQSTFMHEFGHTLGLRHGGNENVNLKTNYISTMNYMRQLPFRLSNTAWRLDYSRGGIGPVNESSLDENTGLSDATGHNTNQKTYYVANACGSGPDPCVNTPSATNVSILSYRIGSGGDDFNADGNITSSVCLDLNYFGANSIVSGGQNQSPCETMTDHDDWSALQYAVPPPPAPFAAEEIIIELTAVAAQQILVSIVPSCPADIAPAGAAGDDTVNVDDLLAVINGWGPCPPKPQLCRADIAPADGNDIVDVDDLLAVINAWGACP